LGLVKSGWTVLSQGYFLGETRGRMPTMKVERAGFGPLANNKPHGNGKGLQDRKKKLGSEDSRGENQRNITSGERKRAPDPKEDFCKQFREKEDKSATRQGRRAGEKEARRILGLRRHVKGEHRFQPIEKRGLGLSREEGC